MGGDGGTDQGAAAILAPASPFYLYGLTNEGFATASSNQAFERSLRDSNPRWGLRNLEAVAAVAQSVGFSAPVITEMPANNLSVVFRPNVIVSLRGQPARERPLLRVPLRNSNFGAEHNSRHHGRSGNKRASGSSARLGFKREAVAVD